MNPYNPYSGNDFFDFFVTLFYRLIAFFKGELPLNQLATDEIQMIVLVGVAVSSAMVGTFLVLRRMTMLANSLSHTILLGIVVAYLLTKNSSSTGLEGDHLPMNIDWMMIASLVMGLVTTFLTEFFTKTVKLQEDASTGLVFTTLFALGIVLVTFFTRSAHVGTEVVMGNVDALQLDDCKLIFLILCLNGFLFFLFFKEFKITTFDPGLSKALGISTIFYNYLLMSQVSFTAIGAFRAVGVLMLLSFITAPPLMARMLTNSLTKMFCYSMIIGSIASIIGVAFSRHMLSFYGIAFSTSGVVVTILFIFLMSVVIFHFLRIKSQIRFVKN